MDVVNVAELGIGKFVTIGRVVSVKLGRLVILRHHRQVKKSSQVIVGRDFGMRTIIFNQR